MGISKSYEAAHVLKDFLEFEVCFLGNFIRRHHLALQVMLLIVLSLAVAWRGPGLRVSGVTLADEDSERRQIFLPFRGESGPSSSFVFSGFLRFAAGASRVLRIVPDDCVGSLHINDRPVPLSEAFGGTLCDYGRGFLINLTPYVHDGLNHFVLKITNTKGGPFGLQFLFRNIDFIADPLFVVFAVLAVLVLYQLVLFFGLPHAVAILVVLGTMLRLYYLSHTEYFDRTYDVLEGGGHLDYIKYVALRYALPPPGEGWEYHQPPLYYILAALLGKLFRTEGTVWEFFALQLFSLLCSIAFLVFACRTYAAVFTRLHLQLLAAALTAFWPSGVIHSVRIANDGLLYCFFAAAIFYTVLWYKHGTKRDFLLAAFFSSLSFVTKTNGIVAMGVLGWLFLWRLGRGGKWREYVRVGLAAALIMTVALVLNFADNAHEYWSGQSEDWLVGNVTRSLNRALYVGNRPVNFLYFDLGTFLREPFTSTWQDQGGRQYFWNFLLKTMLFGEFSFDQGEQRFLAHVLSVLFLVLLLSGLVFVCFARPFELEQYHPLIANLCLLILAAVYYRAKIPASSNNDFRYIFPALISFCALVAAGCASNRQGAVKIVAAIGLISAWLFVLIGAAFFVLRG